MSICLQKMGNTTIITEKRTSPVHILKKASSVEQIYVGPLVDLNDIVLEWVNNGGGLVGALTGAFSNHDIPLSQKRKYLKTIGHEHDFIFFDKYVVSAATEIEAGWNRDPLFKLEGVIVKYKGKNRLLVTGDPSSRGRLNDFIGYRKNHDLNDLIITTSFRCLTFAFGFAKPDAGEGKVENGIARAALRLADTSIKILDMTEDWQSDRIPVKNGKPLKKSPVPGATWIAKRKKYHRAGGLLLKRDSTYVLLSTDDDSYFSSVLSSKAATIPKAFESLQPPETKNVKGVQRQGDWFFIPEDAEKDAEVCFDEPTVRLYRGGNGNDHKVEATDITIHNGRLVYQNPFVSHDQHPDLELKGWFSVVPNTAIESFSEEGVD